MGERVFETLLVSYPEPGLMLITLNRPDVRNAINTAMGLEMASIFHPLAIDPGDLRCIVITGAGDRAFCSGGDLKQRHGMTDADWRAQHAIFEDGARALLECPIPVIAAVNGVAYAGGCELALRCDFVYAVRNTRFALTEVTIGIMPGNGGTQNLPRAVGERRAKELILTGRPFSSEQAYEWGMVNRLCDPEELMPAVLDTARAITANAPISVRQAKASIHYGLQMDLASGLSYEVQAYNRMVTTEDRREGIAAFNEKRKPRFTGR